MGTSAWFDYNVYMTNKLAEVAKADPAYGWDFPKLINAFAAAGYVDKIGAEKHFIEHGQYEDVAPNAFFNATEYYRFKAAEVYGIPPKDVTNVEAASMQVAIKNAGMSAWSHYEQFGNTEGVNPSNSFNTAAYMQAKVDALNLAAVDGKTWTVPLLNEAFKAAGLSALEHFMIYAGNSESGEVAQGLVGGKIPPEFAVSEENKVNPGGGSEGTTFTLTTDIDNIPGTAGDDVIIGSIGTDSTLNAGDQIDGGAGIDTLKVYAGANFDFATVGLKSVEKLDIAASAANLVFDASKNADVKEIWLKGYNGEVTANIAQKVGLSGAIAASSDVAFKFSGTESSSDAATLMLNSAVLSANGVNVDGGTVSLEKLTIEASGKNSIGDLAGATLESLVLTGAGSVKMGIATASVKVDSVDASKLAGGLELAFDSNATNGTDLKFTGSSNADKLTIDAADIDKKDVLNGGGGKDTLVFSSAANAISLDGASNISNFEVLQFDANSGVDLSVFNVKNELESIVISADFSGTKISNITGKALNDIRFTADAVSGITLEGKDFADPLFAGKKAATLVLDNTADTPYADGVDVTATFNHVKELTIESLIKDGDTATVGNGATGNENSMTLTAKAVEKILVTGNETVTLSFDADDVAATSLVDASGLTNKASLQLLVADANGDQSLGVFGSAGNDFISFNATSGNDNLTVVDKGGNDKLAFIASDVNDLLTLKLEAVDFGDARMIGSDSVAMDFAAGNLAQNTKVVLDLTTEFAGQLTVGGGVITTERIGTVAANGSGSFIGTKLDDGDKFATGSNITVVGDGTNKIYIQIDVDNNGIFDAEADYQLELVGTTGSTVAFDATRGDFTFTAI